ncbi:MAG: hypothetical protein NC204_07680 [Candidatus Amulumruptor caecigallinarius]|nr:hypothetical protein [Candidatus Amulumruptor caecigallinarius]
MKKPGSNSDFLCDRDKELHGAFMHLLRTRSDLSLREMFAEAARQPASRFWVSTYRAAIVVAQMLRGLQPANMIPKKMEMYAEITRRVILKLEKNPNQPLVRAVTEVVESPAPEFYLTPESSRVIIYRIRRRRKQASGLFSSSTAATTI